VWAPTAEPEVHAGWVIRWQRGLTMHNNRGNQWFFKQMFSFERSHWLTSCALRILQSYTLPLTLFL
jgi:hypothetical protein